MVCCSDSEYEEEVITIMTREDDKAEDEITDEVQGDSPSFSNTDQGLECDEHDSGGNIYILLIIHSENLFIPQENICSYQLLQAFIVFKCKNLPKKLSQLCSNLWKM